MRGRARCNDRHGKGVRQIPQRVEASGVLGVPVSVATGVGSRDNELNDHASSISPRNHEHINRKVWSGRYGVLPMTCCTRPWLCWTCAIRAI